jgi:hypothetical protein
VPSLQGAKIPRRRDGEAQRALQPVGAFGPERHDVTDADRVVEVDDRVDARECLPFQKRRPSWVAAGFGAEGADGRAPSDDCG